MDKAIKITNFNLWLGLNNRLAHILKDINIEVPFGKITGIVGASGSGKSMLLKSIIQLHEGISSFKQSGDIYISQTDGKYLDLISTSPEILLECRKSLFGFVFQLSSEILNPSQKILAQLQEKLRIVNYKESDINERCIEVLNLVGIEDSELTLQKYPHQLSGGQLQRILIALGIIHSPKILLIDEPTSALNNKLKTEILELITKLSTSLKMTTILVSHNMKLISKYCDFLAVIDDGVIVEQGDCHHIIDNAQNTVTQKLLGLSIVQESTERNIVSDDVIIELKNIGHKFNSAKSFFGKQSQLILEDFNLEIRKGEILGLIGDSGSGKSTIGRIIAGLLMPDKGEIVYLDKVLENLSKSEYKNYRSNVQIIFQDPLGSLSPHRNGKQVLKEALDVLNKSYDEDFVIKQLAAVSLDTQILEKTPKQMSGGQRQRLLIARALLSQPKILICDEILSSLDTIIKKEIILMLKSISLKHNMAVLFISHDLTIVKEISDRIVILDS